MHSPDLSHDHTHPARARRRMGITLTLAAALAVAACSGGGTGGFSVAASVADLPAEGERAVVAVGDLDAATEAAGLERPAEAASDEGRDWYSALTVNTEHEVFVPVPEMFRHAFGAAGADELGWDLTDVHSFATNEVPPRRTTIVTGDFDEDTLSAELEDLGEGVYSAGSGPDLSTDLEQTTPLRPTGMPLRLAQDGDAIMLDAEEQAVRDWLSGTERDTIAGSEGVLAVAEALDDADVYAAMVLTDVAALEPGSGATQAQAQQMHDAWQQWAITEPFDVLGVGWAMVDDEPAVAVAYHFADTDSAERAVEQVQQVWAEGVSGTGQPISEMFTVQDVAHDGGVVTATLSLGPAGLPQHAYDMIQRQEVTVGYLEP